MKLKSGVSISELLKQIGTCKNDVYFETQENDRLNLKSQLSQYIFLTICCDKESDLLEKGWITCLNQEDKEIINRYIE